MTTTNEPAVRLDLDAKRVVLGYVAVSALVLALMMVLGLLMRLAQGEALAIPPDLTYQIMTIHGIGMVGIAGFSGAAIMWYFANQHLQLTLGVFQANFVIFLLGVVAILMSVFLGGFAGGWTFLYPLPAHSGGVWEKGAATAYLFGLLLIGVGFLLLYLDVARAVIEKYGSLAKGLGWPQLFAGDEGEAPPPVVVACTVVLIINTLSIVCGAAIVLMCLINIIEPAFAINPLLAKNLIYVFGHVFINAAIYMAVVAIYEILPRHTGRPWKTTRVLLGAWTATGVMVVLVYPHHLLMDFVMPVWMLAMGQIISYCSGLPVLLVTAWGALANIYRSGMRWNMTSGFLILAVFGWSAGVLPAIVDGTIVVNYVMHNTMWVPGHFHFYLLLGLVPMIFAFMYFLVGSEGVRSETNIDKLAFWAFVVGALGFVMMFLYSGLQSVPRRWAVHFPEWLAYDQIASVFAALAVAGVLVFMVRFLAGVPRLYAAD
ncbi:MAG: cbb3-type cytochrome c oxidase subunit I [Alphaproteobacteria bacterium]|jgi:cytochrome c oxidase subunit 1|nr:cbb3-type cytochrome c oxidase subunit I [Alphaproteobacteria bacterium]|tara:strand:+ start:917 stop:2374 length:1458 start_codon:yes stop_codon:yes gene_type:complete